MIFVCCGPAAGLVQVFHFCYLIERLDRMNTAIERLPFTVGIATERDLQAVAKLRSLTYGRHLPGLGAKLREPEAADFEAGCQVILAKSKLDGEVLGTLRTHANIHKPLPLQASIDLPDNLTDSLMVETTRLSILGSPNSSLVRCALFKALYTYCIEQKVDWMLAAGRNPVDRIYDGLLFEDVMEKGAYYPMAHAAGLPHRVMKLSPSAARSKWAAQGHPLYSFMVETQHPDITLAGAGKLRQAARVPTRHIETRTLLSPIQDGIRRFASMGMQLQVA